MRRVLSAYELDGSLHLMVDCGRGCTHALALPAGSTRDEVSQALRAVLNEQEARERRKVHRKDLEGDLPET